MSYNNLTIRQKQVLDLICKGFTDNEIAKILGISLTTEKSHYSVICDTYNVSGSARRTRLVIKRFKEPGFNP